MDGAVVPYIACFRSMTTVLKKALLCEPDLGACSWFALLVSTLRAQIVGCVIGVVHTAFDTV